VAELIPIDVVNSGGRVLLRTVWSIERDRQAGRRHTDIETVAEPSHLKRRLAELVRLIAGHLLATSRLLPLGASSCPG
jgi:hypothetical protein